MKKSLSQIIATAIAKEGKDEVAAAMIATADSTGFSLYDIRIELYDFANIARAREGSQEKRLKSIYKLQDAVHKAERSKKQAEKDAAHEDFRTKTVTEIMNEGFSETSAQAIFSKAWEDGHHAIDWQNEVSAHVHDLLALARVLKTNG